MKKNILKNLATPYVDSQTLLGLLTHYKKPREWILRMIKNEELIRIKNGFYVIADKVNEASYEQIANILYGPSYVSLEWALSFYGLIPERVFTITSMTLGKNKNYSTPIGEFKYYTLASSAYPIGIAQKETAGETGFFLMATPEKALADFVNLSCRGLNKNELALDLMESRRIEKESLQALNYSFLKEIGQFYRSKSVKTLVELIGDL